MMELQNDESLPAGRQDCDATEDQPELPKFVSKITSHQQQMTSNQQATTKNNIL